MIYNRVKHPNASTAIGTGAETVGRDHLRNHEQKKKENSEPGSSFVERKDSVKFVVKGENGSRTDDFF